MAQLANDNQLTFEALESAMRETYPKGHSWPLYQVAQVLRQEGYLSAGLTGTPEAQISS